MKDQDQDTIFLDIDGVMISEKTYLAAMKGPWPGFDPEAVRLVNDLVARRSARIVFNTTWNSNREDLAKEVRKSGLVLGSDRIVTTGYPMEQAGRLGAIRTWLKYFATPSTAWVALDDETIESPKAIWVDPAVGIDEGIIRKAVQILTGASND